MQFRRLVAELMPSLNHAQQARVDFVGVSDFIRWIRSISQQSHVSDECQKYPGHKDKGNFAISEKKRTKYFRLKRLLRHRIKFHNKERERLSRGTQITRH